MASYSGMRFIGSTTDAHSERMSMVRSRGNKTTEMRLREILKAYGLTGWRRHFRVMGCPDFAFPAERVAIFVDGCFWHGCPKCQRTPQTNSAFWVKKFATNRARDREVTKQLRATGWHVIRIWEHSLKDAPRIAARLRRTLSKARRDRGNS